MGQYYSKLFQSKNIGINQIENYLDKVPFEHILDENMKDMMEGMPTQDELQHVLGKLKDNKSPGCDGLPVEFYRKFWFCLKEKYMMVLQECYEIEVLPNSTRTSVLAAIFKSNNNQLLDNYRPLSLSNTDYKIVAFVFAERMKSIMEYIINPDQTAGVKGRNIVCSIRNLLDIYEYCEESKAPGGLLLADYKKAYDSLEHNFMFAVLKRLNFGPVMLKWIKILYNDAKFIIKNNGWLSRSYDIQRGIRQGCPVSVSCFIIVVEVLRHYD